MMQFYERISAEQRVFLKKTAIISFESDRALRTSGSPARPRSRVLTQLSMVASENRQNAPVRPPGAVGPEQ